MQCFIYLRETVRRSRRVREGSLSVITDNLLVESRRQVDFFAKVLADGTMRLFVTLRLSAVRQRRFFCQAFLDKKAGFWLLFSKSNINY